SASQRRAKNDSSGSAMCCGPRSNAAACGRKQGRGVSGPRPGRRQSLVALRELDFVLDVEGQRGALRGKLAADGDVGVPFADGTRRRDPDRRVDSDVTFGAVVRLLLAQEVGDRSGDVGELHRGGKGYFARSLGGDLDAGGGLARDDLLALEGKLVVGLRQRERRVVRV